MKQLLKDMLIFTAGVIVTGIIMTILLSPILKEEKNPYINALEKECAARTKIQAAYAAIIHRIWIDKPAYVEDILWESDEFLYLDTLIDGNWEDTFVFWSNEDSINYETNWQYEPDVIPKQPVCDKPAKIVEPIKLTNGHQ